MSVSGALPCCHIGKVSGYLLGIIFSTSLGDTGKLGGTKISITSKLWVFISYSYS
jgi:hypothetical protein